MTDVGRRRDQNEDALLVDDDLLLYVVAMMALAERTSRFSGDCSAHGARSARAPEAFKPAPEESALPGVL
jgi:hypothetical protein